LALIAGVAQIVFALGRPSPQARVADSRFGVVEPHDAPALASELGVGWGRARFHWAQIQPTGPDEWQEAEITEGELASELASGREVVGLLIGIPAWATDERGLPRGLYSAPDSPDNTWATFVRSIVLRYQGRINHWIIWNEPDVWDPSHPGFTWPGNEADFVQLLRIAYVVANQASPEAVIHLGAMSHWWDALYGRELYIRRFLRELTSDPGAAANSYYYDVLTLHLYFHPAGIYELIETYAAIQREFGLDKPIWLVETNAAPSYDPAWPVESPTFEVSLAEQAAFIPQVFALALAAGAQRVAVYKLIDTPGDYAANPEPFGLVRADGSRRPAFTTTRVAIERLSGIQSGRWVERGEVSHVILEGNGRVTSVLWTRIPVPQEVRIPAQSDWALLYDMWGAGQTIYPVDGSYRVELSNGECQQTTGDYCMIGGPPVYLVEEVGEEQGWLSPEATVTLSAMAVPDDPTATIVAGPTATVTSSPMSTATATITVTASAIPTRIAASPTPASAPTDTLQPSPLPTATVSYVNAPTRRIAFVTVGVVIGGAVVWALVWYMRQRIRLS
jgi:hypothetical protein